MKTYEGYRVADRPLVVVVDGGDRRPLKHHVRHSPSGFEWGYAGSGPRELARCILLDHFGLDGKEPALGPLAMLNYHKFKQDVIAQIPHDEEWVLSSRDVRNWIDRQRSAA